MRIIARSTLRLFWEAHPDAEQALKALYDEAYRAEWSSPTEPLVVDPMLDGEVPTPPTDLAFEDSDPLETPRHRIAMNVLSRSVQQALRDRFDFYAGGNMFVYYSRQQAMSRDFRGPDVFVALDVDGER